MKMRRLLACIMALLLSASLPVSTLADTYDLANGSVSVNASESGQTVTQENNPNRQDYPDSNPEISSSTATSNTVTITAEENATANVTLSGVNIDTTTSTSDTAETKAAITVAGAGNVVIELDGDNTVQSGEGHAGVEKDNSGSLTITDKNDSPGSLEATGGAGGSGIGGGDGAAGSKITISGGTVEATGGAGGSGIGGGDGRGGSKITISGGTVEATGSAGGAGIGGGDGGRGSEITISGGTVEATGGERGAGIGGGDGGNGGIIRINGGTVTAQGGTGGAGIGGGDGGDGTKITIRGGTVEATGGEGGAGIGGGDGHDGSNITISGGTVAAIGGENAAGIGGGDGGDGNDIVIIGGRVEATGGDAPNKGSGDKIEIGVGGGAGIGGGAYGTGSNISICNDAVVTAEGKGNASNIGFGHPKDSTGQFPDRVDVSNLTPSGSVNGVRGSYQPDANDDDSEETGDGYLDFTTGKTLYKGYTIGTSELKLTNSKGQKITGTFRVENDELRIIIDAAKATLTGDRADIQSLKDQGAETTVLETERLSVSVSNDLLLEITNEDESFQLHTESTGFRLTTTDQNHQKKFDMKLTTDGTQAEPQETQQDTSGLVTFDIDFSKPSNDDSLNRLLHILSLSASHNATITLSGDSLQTLTGLGFATTALTAGGLTIGFENSEVMEKIVATLASGELTIDSENGGVVNKTDANVGYKLDHASVILKNNGGQSDNAMGIILYTNGGQSDNAQGSQTTDCSWMTKYFTNFKILDG